MTNSVWDDVLPTIFEDLRQRRMAIVLADTGMGKSSEVPQFLLQFSLQFNLKKKVAVFVPRRVAAKCLAQYVSKNQGDNVGYSIGGESMNSKSAQIIYLTTAMLGKGATLEAWAKTCIIVVDECMKSDIDTHTCFTLAKEVHRLGGMVVLMGTFIDQYAVKFFFDVPLSAEVRGEKHPVQERYWGDLYGDMPRQAADAVKWICSNANSYEGSILVFLAGFKEIENVQEHLSWEYGLQFAQLRSGQVKQERDFALTPSGPGLRKVILSTEVAEESLTIDGVAYVVDTLQKRKAIVLEGMEELVLGFISQVTAKNRKGRIGRTAPGECIRLCSKEQFSQLDINEKPDFEKQDLRSSTLTLAKFKLSLDDLPVPPSKVKVEYTYLTLENIEAVENRKLTPLGSQLVQLPLDVDMGLAALECASVKTLKYCSRTTQKS